MAIINKHTEEFYSEEYGSVIKTTLIKFLGIKVKEITTFTWDNTIIHKFVYYKADRNKIGFKNEVENKTEETDASQDANDNKEGRMD